MDRGTFKIWLDEMHERQGLFRMTAVEADAEYNLLMQEEEDDKWLANLDGEDDEEPASKHLEF